MDYLIKVLIIGQSNVGKTSLLTRYVDKVFYDDTMSSIGVDFKLITLNLEIDGIEHIVKVQLWDTAGQDRFQAVTRQFYRGAHAAIVVFALDDLRSFERVDYWMTQLDEKCIVKLVGNKCDKPHQAVSERAIKELNIDYIQTSAKSGENVKELFEDIARTVLSKFIREKIRADGEKTSLLLRQKETQAQNESRGCCGGTG